MSIGSNVYSQGGGGNDYELQVQTAYFISFILGIPIPGLNNSRITSFRQQGRSLSYKTDDFVLKTTNGIIEQLALFLVKHNIIISEKSQLFRDVLLATWKDFQNQSLFDPSKDRIFLVKSSLTSSDKNHLKEMLWWAKAKASTDDFINEIKRVKIKQNLK